MNKWQDPSLSLGERCVSFSENEMRNGVKEDKHGSFTSPRIKEYFSICTRLVSDKETKVPLESGNWCAASASFALKESLLPGEDAPHGFRLGVVEIVSDLTKKDLYITKKQALNKEYQIKTGDLIVFDRSNPSDPTTAWYRHIGRVLSVDDDQNFSCISGNSLGAYRITKHTMSQATLLGFGKYPDKKDVEIDLCKFHDVFKKINPSYDG